MSDNNDTYIEQAKILRVFELINLLTGTKSTAEQIGRALDVSERTVFRYIRLLEEVGFQIVHYYGKPVRYSIGSDYYPVFVSHFREDVWKLKARIHENPEDTRKRELLEQEMEVANG